jgi:hypothetical protein
VGEELAFHGYLRGAIEVSIRTLNKRVRPPATGATALSKETIAVTNKSGNNDGLRAGCISETSQEKQGKEQQHRSFHATLLKNKPHLWRTC